MGKLIKKLTRYDSGADLGFVERVRAAFVTAEEAEQALTGAGGMSDSEAARLRMLGRRRLPLVLCIFVGCPLDCP